jgi:hypothetical protein
MSRPANVRRWLVAYPAGWRERYGEELALLVEDAAGGGRVPATTKLSLLGTGLTERLRSSGLRGDETPPARWVRSGSLLVLCSWALMVLGGISFAKYVEHWEAAVGGHHRTALSLGFGGVLVTAEVAAALVVLGAALVLPAFVRSLRAGGWTSIRRHVVRAGTLTVVLLTSFGGLVAWASQLTAAQRNGGSPGYSALAVGVVLLFAATLAAWLVVTVVAVSRLELPPRVIRLEGALALGVAACAVVVLAATVVWWTSMAGAAPQFFGSSSLATPIVVTLALMGLGVALALAGSTRIIRGLRQPAPSC